MNNGVTLYGPSGTGTDLGRLLHDLAQIVKSIQLGYFMADGVVTDAKVAANAAIAQSKVAGLVAALAALVQADATESAVRADAILAEANARLAHQALRSGAHGITVSATAPSLPSVNDIWVDIS